MDLVEIIKQIVQQELARVVPSHIGVVETISDHADGDQENYGCDVRLRGRDLVLTGVPLATPHLGTVAPPQAGDLVLVEFVGGDINQPVVTGRFYSDELRAPKYAAGGILTLLPPDAGASDRVEIAATGGQNGSRKWSVKLPDDTLLSLADKQLAAQVGGLKLTIDGDGSQVSIETGGAKIIVKDGGDVEITGNGNLKIGAQGNLEVTAGGQLSLKANGVAELKGSVVNIN